MSNTPPPITNAPHAGANLTTRYRTLIVLTAAQCFGQTAVPLFVLLGGIVGAQLAPSLDWATLPAAALIIGMAAATMPASLLMARFGRKAGYLGGTALSIFGALLAAWATTEGSFALFCLAAFLVGCHSAVLQQFRFAVAESVPTERVSRALSILMLAGIFAALVGPAVGERFSAVPELAPFTGSFLALAALVSVSFFILLLCFRNLPVLEDTTSEPARPLSEVLRQPQLVLAIAASAIGYSVMSLVMTATPIAMHEMHQHSLADTTWVIQSHILAMFLPSLFSGVLIARLGVMRIISAGLLLLGLCIVLGWGEPALMHYWGTMVLLGIGWNFLFLGGTTLLTQSYRPSERYQVQAANDFAVFGTQAAASLGAGVLLAAVGWNGVLAFSVPWLLLLLPALFIARRGAPRLKPT
ncbi:MAG: MFS transporter [Pseudomonadota bacterium]